MTTRVRHMFSPQISRPGTQEAPPWESIICCHHRFSAILAISPRQVVILRLHLIAEGNHQICRDESSQRFFSGSRNSTVDQRYQMDQRRWQSTSPLTRTWPKRSPSRPIDPRDNMTGSEAQKTDLSNRKEPWRRSQPGRNIHGLDQTPPRRSMTLFGFIG